MEEKKEILLHPNDHKREKDWIEIFNFLDKKIKYEQINSSLDLGCGRGDVSYHILQKNPNGSAICIDVDQKLLDEASKRSERIKTLDFNINQKLPFKNNCFDLVSSIGTLPYPYIKSFEGVFSEMVRVSKKYIVVDFLYKYRVWPILISIRHPGIPPKRHTERQIKKIIGKNNLKVMGKFGTRVPFGNYFASFGRITIFVLEKQNAKQI